MRQDKDVPQILLRLEQAGQMLLPVVEDDLSGTDADRDYWFGEDDIDEVFGGSADYNTADEQTWIQIGEKSGYAISDKKNEVIDDGFLTGAYEGYQVRQIRWVVKAVPVREVNGTTVADVNDDTLSTKVAVPHGFRLDTDAVPDDTGNLKDTNGNTIEVAGKQEADEFDPLRLNVGWGYRKNASGQVMILDSAGNRYPDTTAKMPTSMTNATPIVNFATSLVNTPSIGQGSQNPPEDGGSIYEADPDVHVNHFVSATPRYDDTKYIEGERSRAGFIRTPESPVLSLELIQGYFAGNGTSGYQWATGASTIDKGSSRMMRYRIILTNLSDDQMAALNFKGYDQDYCANPQISEVLPYVEGFGSAVDMNDAKLHYVDYDDLFMPEDLENGIGSHSVYKSQYKYFDWNYKSVKVGNKPHSNIDAEQPLWTYYVADMNDYLQPQTVLYNKTSSTPQLTQPSLTPRETSSFRIEDKAAGVDSGANYNRKMLNWRFTGATTAGETDRGILAPGEGIVIELIMPIEKEASDMLSEDLLTTSAYGYKPGNFKPYTPATSDNDGSTRGLVSDTRPPGGCCGRR